MRNYWLSIALRRICCLQRRYDKHRYLDTFVYLFYNFVLSCQVLGNKSAVFLEQRQKHLELYLQKVLTFLQLAMCREFVEFLNFNQYDIIYLLQDMAQKFFLQQTNNSHEFTTLEMYAISSRLKMPCPITESYQKSFDFSHVLDYCAQLQEITVRQHHHGKGKSVDAARAPEGDGVPVMVGSSNIDPGTLSFDLIAFRGLKKLLLDGVSPDNITDTGNARETLTNLTIHNTRMTHINQILLCDCIHKDQLDDTKQWSALTHLDLSNNSVRGIDASIALLPKLQILLLDNNRIASIAYLNQLPCLSQLELSRNQIGECVDCHLELGNIRTLNLSQNRLRSLHGFRKMYSLVALDVSNNQVTEITEVDHVAMLPCLEELVLNGNPLATIVGEFGLL